MADMKKLLLNSLAAILLALLCIRYLDIPFAQFILDRLGRRFLLGERISSMPDLLAGTVAIVSALCWTGYFLLSGKGIRNGATSFFKILGTSLPAAFFLKDLLKWIFGRVDTRIWLAHPDSLSFHWFHGTGNFHGFPSGHMLVFAPIFLALWDLLPSFRAIFLSGWIFLAAALLVTEYHFLGDVVAGSYLGFLVHYATSRIYKTSSP